MNIDDAVSAAPSFDLSAAAAAAIRDEILVSLDVLPELADLHGLAKRDLETIQAMAPRLRP